MAGNARGLGNRGVNALIINTKEERPVPQAVPLDDLLPNPQQPRKCFSTQQLEELAASIQAQGILQPLLVRPLQGVPGKYEIIAGERRWRASQIAGLATVPVMVRDLNDQEALLVALMENLQREDLAPLEEAQGMQQLKDEFGLSQEDVARQLGKSRSAVANALRLLSLPEKAREDLAEGRISAGHARALLAISEPESQELFRIHIVKHHISVREAEQLVSFWKDNGSFPPEMAGTSGSASTRSAKSSDEKKNGTLATLQETLGKLLAMPVTVTGKDTRGCISVRYNSKEELEVLLRRLGHSGGAL